MQRPEKLSDFIKKLPSEIETETVKDRNFKCCFLKASDGLLKKGGSEAFELNGLSRYLALRKQWVWSYPQFGDKLSDLPEGAPEGATPGPSSQDGTQFLLWERNDGTSCLLLPLVDGNVRTALESRGESLRLAWRWEPEGTAQESALILAAAWGKNPLKLVRQTMQAVVARLKAFRLRTEKRSPEFMNYLGWCTWDAFYRDVDERKALAGLASFARGGVAPGFMILDDGWLDVDKDEALISFGANREKFPDGIARLVEKAKREHGIKLFGVWHAFEGYWKGVSPKSELVKRRLLLKTRRRASSATGKSARKLVERNLVKPEAASDFYNEWHAELRKAGVDLVKIDNQSGLDVFVMGKRDQVASMRKYQEALQGATQNFFLGNCISCMSNGSDVLFNMSSSNVIRSSNDYFPKQPVETQGAHIVNNAMNSIWFSNFATPDWDMFQSHGPCAEFHAAARALSGGPVYICDEPGRQVFSIIRKLCISGSRVLRFDEPALPLPECVYDDPQKTKKALKIVNRKGALAALGLFNCHDGNLPIKTSFKPCDIESLHGQEFAVRLHKAGKAFFAKAGMAVEVELDAQGWEIATISPLENGAAPLGLADKYAGAAAVLSSRWFGEDVFVCELADGGLAVFLSKRKPRAVLLNMKRAAFNYDDERGLLLVEVPEGDVCEARILF